MKLNVRTNQVKVIDSTTQELLDEGKLLYQDEEKTIIEDKSGIEKIYDTTKVVVKMLPLIEAIIEFFKRLFGKKKKQDV